MDLLSQLDFKEHIEKKIFEKIKEKKCIVGMFGAGGAGFYLNKWLTENGINPICFIDDDEEKQKSGYMGIDVRSYKEFKEHYKNYVIFVGIANNAVKAMNNLIARGERNPVYFIGSRDPWSEVTTIEYIKENIEGYEKAFELLEDDFSKKVFIGVLNNKLTGLACYIENIKTQNMYFDTEIIKLSPNEIFLDVGACDGQNCVEFANNSNYEYERLIVFEPDKDNIFRIKEKFKENSIVNFEIVSTGAWDKKDVLTFNSGLEHTSNISSDGTGNIEIHVDSIDNYLEGKRATFIKMDIEGAEKQAIIGCKETIKKYKPKLAISVYHKREDFYELILLINKYNPNYKYYLRNYTDTAADTVLYAV